MKSRGVLFGLLALVSVIALVNLVPEDVSEKVSESDKQLLLQLIGDPLTDPKGKQYCTVTVVARSCWGSSENLEISGWYQAASDKINARVYFTDGDWIAAPKNFKNRDFLAESTAVLASLRKSDDIEVWRRRIDEIGDGSAAPVPDLARAAWLLKLGHEDVAAKIVAKLKNDKLRGSDDPVDELPDKRMVRQMMEDLAWRAYSDAVNSYMQAADEEALRHCKRLNILYPDFVNEFGDGEALVAELKRREQAKTLGVVAPEKPADFDNWEQNRQVQWLIEQLDQVNARQRSQPGGVNPTRDWRVEALINIGEPAVEPLIETVDSDERLTRSVSFWRDFSRSRTVMPVRDAALGTVMGIFATRTAGDLTYRGRETADETASETAAHLRTFWKKVGQVPLEDRMMAVLTDKTSKQEATRRAAMNLSNLQTGGPDEPNPAIEKFKDPTTAEAILMAMDRDLAQRQQNYRHRDIESTYVDSVKRLGDKRITPELRRRCEAADTVRKRRMYATALNVLGDPEPLNKFAKDFQAGKITLPDSDR